jgi:transcriptional regulator of acetoin/glycerol metabolism
LPTDKRWQNHKHIALEHGLKACFSFPIFSASKEVLGTFGCYYKQVHLPDNNDIQLIERAVNIAGILIERDKSQKQIHRKEEQLQQISSFVPGAIYQFQLKKDGSINFPYFSPTIKELYNISPEEIYHDPQNILKKIHPED